MYGSVLVIITLMYLSGLIWTQCVIGWSPYNQAPLDKVGGNYWGAAWLSSQGHFFFFFFFCFACRKQQGFSLAYIFRTPWLSFHFQPLSPYLFSLTLSLFACTHSVWGLHACTRIYSAYCKKKDGACLLCLILRLIKGEHGSSSFFSLSKLGHELYSAASNYQPCGEIEGERKERSKGGMKS